MLLHHPYDSYDAVIAFIESAAEDEHVLSIKQTLYRTNEHSLIVPSLMDAASLKEVTAVVELKARFDEAHNIRWARDLEDAGVQVFHGLVGLKTHCKLSLLVRRDPDGVRSYAHIGTGNYNATTARIYTDLSLFTANPEITRAVHDVFSFLTAYAENPSYDPLLVAPLDLAEKTIALIDREGEHARQGRRGPDHREDECAAGQECDSGVVPGVTGGSGDRFDCAGDLCFAAGGARVERPDQGAEHCGAISGAQPDLLFWQRGRRRNLYWQRGLDATEFVRARGSAGAVAR